MPTHDTENLTFSVAVLYEVDVELEPGSYDQEPEFDLETNFFYSEVSARDIEEAKMLARNKIIQETGGRILEPVIALQVECRQVAVAMLVSNENEELGIFYS